MKWQLRERSKELMENLLPYTYNVGLSGLAFRRGYSHENSKRHKYAQGIGGIEFSFGIIGSVASRLLHMPFRACSFENGQVGQLMTISLI
jgi:hypothetical protein